MQINIRHIIKSNLGRQLQDLKQKLSRGVTKQGKQVVRADRTRTLQAEYETTIKAKMSEEQHLLPGNQA